MSISISNTFSSKLPHVGTTIFAIMSGLANECNAINLSQGFPNFPASPELISLVNEYMKKGYNQYAPMTGIKELREAVAKKTFESYGINYHPEKEVTITSGGTEALFSAISSVVTTGDEVIIFEPAYDSYAPVIELNGGITVPVILKPPFYEINWQEVKSKVSSRTKLIIINTPQNPAGTVLSEPDLDELVSVVSNTNIILLGDEVYEHIIFEGLKHHSLMTRPVLQERSFIIGSFGKTFHVTGWKAGVCQAPEYLTKEFRKIHQFVTFCTFTPVQYALADFMKNPDNYNYVPKFYERKRDIFLAAIKGSRFRFVPSKGSYFQNLSYEAITDENDFDLAVRLTKEIGVASVPVSVFYSQKNDYKMLRFCFAKDDETLQKAGERLSKL